VNRARRPPLSHPLASVFDHAVDSLSAALHPDTTRHYCGTVRKFLTYLGTAHPLVRSLDQLRRDPHILGWMSSLRSQVPPLVTASCINLLIHLRYIFHELAWTEPLPELAHLIRREDVPRRPSRLPRPLTAQQDQLLQQEFLRRNDLGGNAFLLIRHTGMRIGECVDLLCSCLHSTGPHPWAIHVPLGKLQTERMVPVDSFVGTLIHRLRFFAPSIRYPLMVYCSLARVPRMRWCANSATTYTRYVTRSASPRASCRISFDIPMPQRWLVPVWASLP
jgi:integrase